MHPKNVVLIKKNLRTKSEILMHAADRTVKFWYATSFGFSFLYHSFSG